MGTPFQSIYDLFTSQVQDYRMIQAFKNSEEDFERYLEPFLLFAIEKFSPHCKYDLIDNIDEENQLFTIDITMKEKLILSRLMLEFWMNKVVNNILQMDNKLSDTDFKTYSEAQNLKEKQTYLATIREDNSQLITNYCLNYKVPWKEWIYGRFSKDVK